VALISLPQKGKRPTIARGMGCLARSACGGILTGAARCLTLLGASGPFRPLKRKIDRYPPVTRPIVRTHPVTGHKCLYVMRDDCTGIEGIEGREAETLIDALADLAGALARRGATRKTSP
jgi:hypothetical protein